jgi:hypothetical protein
MFILEALAVCQLYGSRKSLSGWLLAAITTIILFLSISTAAIGCLPLDWYRYLCDNKQHSEYRQISPHYEEIVRRKYLTTTGV